MGDVILCIVVGTLVILFICGMVSNLSSAEQGKIWKETFDNAEIKDISTVIERCGEPTEILENANGALYLLSYGYYYQEGEDADLSECTIYAWKRLKNNGYSYVHQTQAMVYFVRESKIVFRYAHKLHTK